MKVMVTGGGGYLGAVLCERLIAAGHGVRVVDRLYWGLAPLDEIRERVEIVQQDVRELDDAAFDGVEAVVHLAGLSNDPTAEYNPTANWEMNAIATQRLAAMCKRHGIKRLTFGSSASLYDGLGDGTFDETAAVVPRGAYSQSKHAAEEALLRAADASFEPVILRQGTIYGWSPRMRFDLVVNTFVKDALLRAKLFLHGGGWMWRPLVDVGDAADAHVRCLTAPSSAVAGQIFNVVHDNYQIRQLAMLVSGSLNIQGRHVELVDAPLPRIARNYRCANRKLHEAIGFSPHVTPLEAIERILLHVTGVHADTLAHPKYYNIEWMTLIDQVKRDQAPFDTVWDANPVAGPSKMVLN